MALTKILIAVKTYPTLSEKYDELVCTAGFREDGSWIRIYPIPYRKLQYTDRYEKWQWVELDVTRNTKDFRKESYRPTDIENEFILGEKLDTKNNWAKRKQIVLQNVRYNMNELIAEAQNKEFGTSLAILKPKEVKKFIWENCTRKWDKKKLDAVIANQAQGSLFDKIETEKIFKIAKKVPYKFSYIFTTDDNIERTLMIEDWEVGMLYWNSLKLANGDEDIACQKVKEKYFDTFIQKCDLYFLLGTTKKFHNIAPNPFIIIGTFYPPKEDKQQLFLF
ncbi:MAG: hypothetical protein PHH23_03610 [Paludibacteraceae bacterium]|nr:hypothetical protein [Paludibacteraceae bacterium]